MSIAYEIFELSGIGLDDADKQRYGELVKRMSELTSSFSNQLLDATQAWTKLVTDEAELAGLPESAVAAAKAMAAAKEQDGWLFTLDFPSYLPVMTYSENRQLREEYTELSLLELQTKGLMPVSLITVR